MSIDCNSRTSVISKRWNKYHTLPTICWYIYSPNSNARTLSYSQPWKAILHASALMHCIELALLAQYTLYLSFLAFSLFPPFMPSFSNRRCRISRIVTISGTISLGNYADVFSQMNRYSCQRRCQCEIVYPKPGSHAWCSFHWPICKHSYSVYWGYHFYPPVIRWTHVQFRISSRGQ